MKQQPDTWSPDSTSGRYRGWAPVQTYGRIGNSVIMRRGVRQWPTNLGKLRDSSYL